MSVNWNWARKLANLGAVVLAIFLLLYFTGGGKVWDWDSVNNNQLVGDSSFFYGSATLLSHGNSPYVITEQALKPDAVFLGAPYCYLPTLATILIPFTGMSIFGMTLVWYLIITLSIIFSCFLIYKIGLVAGVTLSKGWNFPAMVGIVSLLFEPIQNNYIHAQSNPLLLVSIVATLYLYLIERRGLAGFTLGFGIALKFFPLIFIPFFIFRKEWKLLIFAGASLLFWLVLPLLYIDGVRLYSDFYTVITARSASEYNYLEFFTTLYRTIIWFYPVLLGKVMKLVSICIVFLLLVTIDCVLRKKCKESGGSLLFVNIFVFSMYSTSILVIHPHSEVHIMVFSYLSFIFCGIFALQHKKVLLVIVWACIYGLFCPLLWLEETPIAFISLVLLNACSAYIAYRYSASDVDNI